MTPIMAHMIPFFPDLKGSETVAQALIDSEVAYIEVQFPYSDPSADGPVIEGACTRALKQGFKVDAGFDFVKKIHDKITQKGSQTKIFIMSYASIPFSVGVSDFVKKSKEAGVSGLIIPDLPIDYDEGLAQACREYSIHCVPVTVPFMSKERIKMVLDHKPAYIYCALRAGITGSDTAIDAQTIAFLDSMKVQGSRLLGGFGIRTKDQVSALSQHVHAAVLGSALVRVIEAASSQSLALSVKDFIKSLN